MASRSRPAATEAPSKASLDGAPSLFEVVPTRTGDGVVVECPTDACTDPIFGVPFLQAIRDWTHHHGALLVVERGAIGIVTTHDLALAHISDDLAARIEGRLHVDGHPGRAAE